MTPVLPPRRELDFQLHDVLAAEELARAPRYSAHDRAVFDGVLDGAYRLAAKRYAPHAAIADVAEPRLVHGCVEMPSAAAEALSAAAEAGYFAASFDTALGGLQLPWLVVQGANAVFAAANVSFYGYTRLTVSAANLLVAQGSPAQVERYVRPMVAGRWFGTMCLSEPHAGSSLADIRTSAVRAPDGTYRLTGEKMWISAGEHDLAENIVHLVLAKVPGGAPGVKGISLFVVPKFVPEGFEPAARAAAAANRNGGATGPRNDVRCIGINHKMGWRGTVSTVLALGREGSCVGELVGEEHRGLSYMFNTMNEARIGVGLCASALGYAGYVAALDYARVRTQGRPLADRGSFSLPVAILRHADVRRMLLAQKAWVEGALALTLYCARLVDEERIARDAGDAATAQELHALLELLTPVAKSWPSEYALRANELAIQVHGGYGYTRDYPVERLYRDNRLNHIHEGTYGIHGLDVLGRKVMLDGGAAFAGLGRRIVATAEAARTHDALAGHARALVDAFHRVAATTRLLVAAQRDPAIGPERALANATPYLDALGTVVVAWRWLDQARAAASRAPRDAADAAFLAGKLAACHWYFRCELPRIGPTLELLDSLDDTVLRIPDDAW